MSEFGFDFNNDQDVPKGDPFLVPAGDYRALISKAEMKDGKKEGSRYVNMTLQILDGEYKNRILFDIIVTHNKNDRAQIMGRQTLNNVRQIVGIETLTEPSQLENSVIGIKVVNKDGDFGVQAEVKKYLDPAKVQGTQSGTAGSLSF